MHELSRHIEELLLKNDCVIVPGLGGFLSQYKPAQYHEKEGIFTPPYRCIGFNAQIQINDGILAQAFMQEYDVNYPESLLMIKDQINELKDTLSTKGMFTFKKIGRLTINLDGQYKFYPSEKGVITPCYYGLDRFKLEKYNDFELSKEEKERKESKNRIRKQYTLHVNRNLVNYSVAAVVSLLFYFISSAPVTYNSYTNSEASVANSIFNLCSFTEVPKAISLPEKMEPTESIVSETNIIEKENSKNKYSIVLVSSVPLQNAKDFIKEMKSKGYNDSYLYEHKNLRRVLYSHFETAKKAVDALNQLKKESKHFSDSWILRIK